MILPRYTRKDGLIMITMLTPVTIVMNLFLFGHRYFAEWPVFIWGSIVTFVIHAISWQFHTAVAVILRNRFPEDSQMFTRIPLAIGVFILMTSLCTTIVFFWLRLHEFSWLQVQWIVLYLGNYFRCYWKHIYHIPSWRGEQLRKMEDHNPRNWNLKERIYSIAINGIEDTGKSALPVQ